MSSESVQGSKLHRKHQIVAASLVAFVCFMIGLSFASVPLYRMFCETTGYGGTPQRSSIESALVSPQTVTVRFDATLAPNLKWSFEPVQKEITVHIGENKLAFFHAKNLSSESITGSATFNLTPEVIGAYFTKIQCFCFEEQMLKAGESTDFAVSFYIDPAMLKDPDTKDIENITLSYTFFQSKKTAALDTKKDAGNNESNLATKVN